MTPTRIGLPQSNRIVMDLCEKEHARMPPNYEMVKHEMAKDGPYHEMANFYVKYTTLAKRKGWKPLEDQGDIKSKSYRIPYKRFCRVYALDKTALANMCYYKDDVARLAGKVERLRNDLIEAQAEHDRAKRTLCEFLDKIHI